MRMVCVVLAVVAGCGSSPSRSKTSQPAPPTAQKSHPSPECVQQAKAGAEEMVDHVAQDPQGVWRMVHGKSEYGHPTTMSEDEFIAFLPTREGREWICGVKGFCASYYFGILNHCEEERAKQVSQAQ